MIAVINLSPPEPNIKEILRYAGVKEADNEIEALIEKCLSEVQNKLTYKVCYSQFKILKENNISFGNISTNSKTLEKALDNCEEVVVFGATVGIEIDRLIAKYGHISPAKALVFQAIGAERIESLCDKFCEELGCNLKSKGDFLHPRVSPGYGDIPLEMQRDIFRLLDCSRKIGLTLNDSLLMSPSKSVTAIAGIGKCTDTNILYKCTKCGKSDCEYRREK